MIHKQNGYKAEIFLFVVVVMKQTSNEWEKITFVMYVCLLVKKNWQKIQLHIEIINDNDDDH